MLVPFALYRVSAWGLCGFTYQKASRSIKAFKLLSTQMALCIQGVKPFHRIEILALAVLAPTTLSYINIFGMVITPPIEGKRIELPDYIVLVWPEGQKRPIKRWAIRSLGIFPITLLLQMAVTRSISFCCFVGDSFYATLKIFSIFLPFANSSTNLSRYLTFCVNGFSISSIR